MIMARIVTFKGRSAEDLQAMSTEDFLKLLNSRERRSYRRMSNSYKALMAKVEKAKKSGESKPIKTHVREAVILPSWIGVTIAAHNGKTFQELPITIELVGRRLGDFAHTTKHVQHSAPGIRATRGSKFLAVK